MNSLLRIASVATLALSALASMAAGYRSIEINCKDGTQMKVSMESGMTTVFDTDAMTLKCDKGDLSLNLSNVANWKFSTEAGSDEHWASIDELPAIDGVTIERDANRIALHNLPAGSQVMLVTIEGRVVNRCVTSGDYELSLSTLTTGVYVLSFNNNAIKIAVAQ